MSVYKRSLKLHAKLRGKLEITPRLKLRTKEDLSLAYTPGVAEPCRAIAKNPGLVWDYTIKNNSVAVVSDGSAVLGLGNIGAKAALPVMEGKAILFKSFANIDAFPICIESQLVEDIVSTVKNIAPVFGGINLEDISSPRCFEVEARLQGIGIPVFHDDQHGTATVVMAALLNALKVVKKSLGDVSVVVCGAGASGIAVSKMLLGIDGTGKLHEPVRDLVLCDSKGAIHFGRTDLNDAKTAMLPHTNKASKRSLEEAMENADVFIGLSAPKTVSPKMVRSMADKAVVFAMANPEPEILPQLALKAGAAVVGTGRSDYPNQINNVLAFPGIFRGALDAHASSISPEMKFAAAKAIASFVKKPAARRILPYSLEKGIGQAVGRAVARAAKQSGVARVH